MKIFNLYKGTLVAILLLVSISCDVTDLDPQNNPNALAPDQYNLGSYVTAVEVNFAQFFEAGTGFGMQLTRMLAMTGGTLYDNAYSPVSFDFLWSSGYQGVLVNTKQIITNADELGATTHAGYARILHAYTLILLTDMFGDIPNKESLLGSTNLNPKADASRDVYLAALEMLEEAIENLNTESTIADPKDMFYNNDKTLWIKLANSLKFKIYLQAAPAFSQSDDSLKALVGRNAMLDGTPTSDSGEDDFQFNWGTNVNAPDSRHPSFSANYDNGASDYMGNYYMNTIINDNGTDPRRRYYFYRQTVTTTSKTNELPCLAFNKPAHYGAADPFCKLASGYWGRDHGDDDGIPPDGLLRTLWGMYPVGGKFDISKGGRGTQASGAKGAGISPIMPSFFVDFMRAEAALRGLTTEDPRVLYEKGIRASIAKVTGFPAEIGYSLTADELALAPKTTDIDTYITGALAKYDAAATKLDRVCKEYLKALWGNGFEAYNMYRRTGFPSDLQPALEPQPGLFIRSFPYPSNFANLNQSVDPKPSPGTQVKLFWDDGSIVLK
jgi:hypothetical protein